MYGTKILFFISIIFTFINGYGCPSFRIGGIRSFHPVLPDFKPIDFKPIDFEPIDFKPIDFKPIDFEPFQFPEYKPISIPHFEPSPEFESSFSHGMDPSLSSLFKSSNSLDDLNWLRREISRPSKTGDGLPSSVKNEASVSKAKSSDTDENLRGKTTRRPNHREMATKDPLSAPLWPSVGDNDYQLQKKGPNYQHYIKNISPQNRRLNIDSGYFYRPKYHYTTHDTGTTALGYSLNEKLNIWVASQQFDDGNYPRYYYTVRDFYQGKHSVPENQVIPSNKIVNCYGNSETICPDNTMALCTYDGTLMCVAIETSTVPCLQGDCIKSTISCDNNLAAECENSKNATINVPCISTLTVYGDIDYKNSTITVNEHGTFATTPNTQHYNFTTPRTAARKRKLSRNFCVGVVLSPTKLPKYY